MKKYGLLIFIFCMVTLCIPFAVIAGAEAPNCTIRGEEVVALPDSNVTMTFTIENNPGIAGAEIIISFDERLTLVGAEAGDAFSALTYVEPSYYRNPTIFMWDSESLNDEDIKDGIILELTFHTPDGVEDDFPVTITYESGNVFDKDFNSMELTIDNGCITSVSYLPGDVDGNGRINTLDITAIRRYISDGRKTDPNGYNVVINENAADVDANGRINTLDITMIRRYISDGRVTDPDGYNIVLKPGKMACVHNLTSTAAKSPTCTESGNIAYWYCNKCNKYFSDETGINEIAFASTVLPSTGHTYSGWTYADENTHNRVCACGSQESESHTWDAGVVIEEATGMTEGTRKYTCAICGGIKTEKIPVTGYTVTFVDYDGKVLKVETVNSGKSATAPTDPMRDGYTFIGWDKTYHEITSDLIITAQYEIVDNQVCIHYIDNGDGTTTAKFSVNGDVNIAMIELQLSFHLTNAAYSGYTLLVSGSADANYTDDIFYFSFMSATDVTEDTELFSITFNNVADRIGIEFTVVDSYVSDGTFTNISTVTIVGTTYND